MLPKLNLFLSLDAVHLSEPLTQTQDSFVDSVLKYDRVVKGALSRERVFARLRQPCGFSEPHEGTAGLVVGPDFFGAGSGFAFEFPGRHKEVEQGRQRRIDGGQEGLFLSACEAVIADILPDDGAVLLLDETIIIFLMVAATGKGDEV